MSPQIKQSCVSACYVCRIYIKADKFINILKKMRVIMVSSRHPVIPVLRKLKSVVIFSESSCIGNVKLFKIVFNLFINKRFLKAVKASVGIRHASDNNSKLTLENFSAVKNILYSLNRAHAVLRSVKVSVNSNFMSVTEDSFLHKCFTEPRFMFNAVSYKIERTFKSVFFNRFKKSDIMSRAVIIAECHCFCFSLGKSDKIIFQICHSLLFTGTTIHCYYNTHSLSITIVF